MYKDNGKLDVELLAEVGCIAHRIRNLDEKLALDQTKSACFKYPYPTSAPKPTLTPTPISATVATVATPAITVDSGHTSPNRKNSTHSIQIAQDIGDKLTDISATAAVAVAVATAEPSTAQTSDGDSRTNSRAAVAAATSAAGCGGRRYSNKHIEDIILEFYEKHLIYHQNLEKERIAAQDDTSNIRSRIYRLTSADNHTMNDSSTVAASNSANNKTTIAATATGAEAEPEPEPEGEQATVEEGDPSSVIGANVERECESRIYGANDGDDAGEFQSTNRRFFHTILRNGMSYRMMCKHIAHIH